MRFPSLDLNKLHCQAASFNTASVRLLQWLELTRDGVLRASAAPAGDIGAPTRINSTEKHMPHDTPGSENGERAGDAGARRTR